MRLRRCLCVEIFAGWLRLSASGSTRRDERARGRGSASSFFAASLVRPVKTAGALERAGGDAWKSALARERASRYGSAASASRDVRSPPYSSVPRAMVRLLSERISITSLPTTGGSLGRAHCFAFSVRRANCSVRITALAFVRTESTGPGRARRTARPSRTSLNTSPMAISTF